MNERLLGSVAATVSQFYKEKMKATTTILFPCSHPRRFSGLMGMTKLSFIFIPTFDLVQLFDKLSIRGVNHQWPPEKLLKVIKIVRRLISSNFVLHSS